MSMFLNTLCIIRATASAIDFTVYIYVCHILLVPSKHLYRSGFYKNRVYTARHSADHVKERTQHIVRKMSGNCSWYLISQETLVGVIFQLVLSPKRMSGQVLIKFTEKEYRYGCTRK